MTLVVAWLRKASDTKELIIVSDSRLTAAGHVDCAQKLFVLPRGDCCLAFCGDSLLSYPIFILVHSAIENYHRDRSRARDISDLSNHVLALVNQYASSWKDTVQEDFYRDCVKTRFLFAGWSWKHADFAIYEYFFNRSRHIFSSRRSRYLRKILGNTQRNRKLVVIGDYKSGFLERLSRMMLHDQSAAFNYEPLQVLRDMLRTPQFIDRNLRSEHPHAGHIGGAPQMVKVYASATSLPHAMWWEYNGRVSVHLMGRPLFDYEVTQFPIWDLDRMRPTYPLELVRNTRPPE